MTPPPAVDDPAAVASLCEVEPVAANALAPARGTRPARLNADLRAWATTRRPATSSLRRLLLRWIGTAGVAASLPRLAGAATCSARPTPAETAGPFAADGGRDAASGLNALTLAGFVRPDLRRSVGGASGTVAGVETQVELRLVSRAGSGSCAPLSGHAVYLWHCTPDGGYSMYTPGHERENYLRGVQVSDAEGRVAFTTVFPGCYPGRWPHLHFEVYASLEQALDTGRVRDALSISQLAVPAAACEAVYRGARGYGRSATTFAGQRLERDGVFADDGAARQLATWSGAATGPLVLTLDVVL